MGLSPKAATTPIPQQAEFETQIDNVGGTKVERVKQPDGTYAIVRSATPLSAEDQAYQDTLKSIQQSSLDFINRLSTNYDRSQIPWLDQYLKDYETTNLKAIDENAASTAQGEEKALARYGQADSTAAAQTRSARFSTIAGQKDQLSRDMSGIEQDARNNELNRQGSLFNLASTSLSGQQSTQLNSLAQLVNSGLAQQQNNQNYNNSVAATIGANNQAKANSQQAGFGNLVSLAALAAAPFTGGATLAIPGLMSASGSGFAGYGKNFSSVKSGYGTFNGIGS